MSSKERRAELEREFEARQAKQREEELRKEALSMWGLIEESDASEDVKHILHKMAQHIGMEQ